MQDGTGFVVLWVYAPYYATPPAPAGYGPHGSHFDGAGALTADSIVPIDTDNPALVNSYPFSFQVAGTDGQDILVDYAVENVATFDYSLVLLRVSADGTLVKASPITTNYGVARFAAGKLAVCWPTQQGLGCGVTTAP